MASARKAKRSTLSRTAASSSTANCRSIPLAAVSALAAFTASGTSLKVHCRRRGAPGHARSKAPTCLLSAPAPRSSLARPSSSCASRTDHRDGQKLPVATPNNRNSNGSITGINKGLPLSHASSARTAFSVLPMPSGIGGIGGIRSIWFRAAAL